MNMKYGLKKACNMRAESFEEFEFIGNVQLGIIKLATHFNNRTFPHLFSITPCFSTFGKSCHFLHLDTLSVCPRQRQNVFWSLAHLSQALLF